MKLRRELETDLSDVDGRTKVFLPPYSRERLRVDDLSVEFSSIAGLFQIEQRENNTKDYRIRSNPGRRFPALSDRSTKGASEQAMSFCALGRTVHAPFVSALAALPTCKTGIVQWFLLR